MATVTITIQDNPMAGMPGQTDVTTTVTCDEPMPLPINEETAHRLTTAQMFAIATLARVSNLTYETAWMTIDQGSTQ